MFPLGARLLCGYNSRRDPIGRHHHLERGSESAAYAGKRAPAGGRDHRDRFRLDGRNGRGRRELGAKVFVEPWKGYAGQKNSALEKATCDWVLSLDADEAVEPELRDEIKAVLANTSHHGYWISRQNFFLGRWIKHGGFYPDRKLRLFRRGAGQFENRLVHEDARSAVQPARLPGRFCIMRIPRWIPTSRT